MDTENNGEDDAWKGEKSQWQEAAREAEQNHKNNYEKKHTRIYHCFVQLMQQLNHVSVAPLFR